ncbi:HAMP domain-containing sensor histidine kinase [Paenibacillus sp. BR2-3]|uniref:sensor histidine kinase n=1 Tax=Paenibacillus sp. BR2-3 TaxID=3048494 RepID=UPI0039772CDB
MTRNLRIGTKLQLSNLILILTILIVTAFSFRVLSTRYLIQDARQQMKHDAAQLLQMLAVGSSLSADTVAERVNLRKELRVAGRLVDTKIIVLNKAGRIVYKNTSLKDTDVLSMLAGKTPDEYLIERRVIKGTGGGNKGEIVLGIKITDITGLNRLFRRAQLLSVIIGGFLALFIGYWLGRSLTRPLADLADGMRNFSPKREQPAIPVDRRSRDEIGELAESFTDMADKLRLNDRLQTDFLQNASHELKTPLMAIQGNAEAIKDGIVQGEEVADSLEVIINECQQLKGLVDEMIFLTRLDQVKDAFHFEPVEIGDVIGEVLAGLHGLAAQHNIKLTAKGDVSAICSADREKLKRAFVNIVGNSIRYAKTSVDLRVKHVGDKLSITCIDDGKGFKPGEEKLVFDRFYKGEQGGTGIGLAITKAIIVGHGGSIAASSLPAGGAVFEIVLNLKNTDFQ